MHDSTVSPPARSSLSSSLEYRPSRRSGIPVTNPLDTLALLGASVSRAVVEGAVHQAVVKRLVTIEGLSQTADRQSHPGRRGPAVLRSILAEWELGRGPAESVLELEMAKVFRRHRLPSPVFQQEVWHDGRLIARIDFAYPDPMIAIEVEGAEHHTHPLTRQRDAERRNRLTQLGWAVIVFTWYDVTRRPEWVAQQVRRQFSAPRALQHFAHGA